MKGKSEFILWNEFKNVDHLSALVSVKQSSLSWALLLTDEIIWHRLLPQRHFLQRRIRLLSTTGNQILKFKDRRDKKWRASATTAGDDCKNWGRQGHSCHLQSRRRQWELMIGTAGEGDDGNCGQGADKLPLPACPTFDIRVRVEILPFDECLPGCLPTSSPDSPRLSVPSMLLTLVSEALMTQGRKWYLQGEHLWGYISTQREDEVWD